MKQYKYTAVNLQKEKFRGTFIAQDEEDLSVQLSKQGLFLISAKPYSGKTPSSFFTIGFGKVSLKELTAFCRQMSIMLNSGLSIIASLDILKEQKFSGYFKQLLEVVTDDVKAGVMLSDAFSKHNNVFPDFFRNMIKVGESSGKLDEVLTSLADYYEKDSSTKRKVKSALSYPMMLGGMTIAIVMLMLLFVVPTFRDSLSKLDITPTGLTKIVYDVSDFLLANWLYMLAIICVAAVLFFLIGKTKRGAYFYDWLKIHVPGIRNLNIEIATSRFARGFGLLLASGMDMNDALDSVVIVLGNRDVRERFKKAAEDVRHGMALAIAFEHYKLFPPILIQMVAVGERTNSLDEILTRSCAFFDETVETSINSMTSKIQPIMLMIMGAIIGTLFIAVYSPMLSIMSQL